jgi:hypothetical protein
MRDLVEENGDGGDYSDIPASQVRSTNRQSVCEVMGKIGN